MMDIRGENQGRLVTTRGDAAGRLPSRKANAGRP